MGKRNNNFSSTFRLLREKKGYTHESLGEALDVSHATISRWESGASKPNYIDFFNAAKLFGVTPEYLMGVDGVDDSTDLIDTISEHDLLSELVKRRGYILKPARNKPRVFTTDVLGLSQETLETMARIKDKEELDFLVSDLLRVHFNNGYEEEDDLGEEVG